MAGKMLNQTNLLQIKVSLGGKSCGLKSATALMRAVQAHSAKADQSCFVRLRQTLAPSEKCLNTILSDHT